MRVAPGHSVFPGGKLDWHIDASLKWLDIFKLPSRGQVDLKTLFAGLITPNSIGRTSNERQNTASLPIEIAYRLCAIRETFEETGILLATKLKSSPSMMSDIYRSSSRGDDEKEKKKNSELIAKWHDRVLNDSTKFIDMFGELVDDGELVPDVFGLHEWANWITPTREKTRFDTFFFTCFLPQVPPQTLLRVNKQENESLEVF